jgi:hypothetical protein
MHLRAAAVGASQVPQPSLQCAPTPTLAGDDSPSQPSAVHSLARFWLGQGTDDGSRVSREIPARFYEGLRLKRRDLLTFLQSRCAFECDDRLRPEAETHSSTFTTELPHEWALLPVKRLGPPVRAAWAEPEGAAAGP